MNLNNLINKEFYHTLEQKFRGSREDVKLRLRFYLPFIETLISTSDHVKALDLGSGRGEWLELLKDWGIDGLGIDCDELMLKDCQNRGLVVRQDDAVNCL